MKSSYLIWSTFLIASLSMNGLCVRALALAAVPYYDSLSSRGWVCLLLVVFFSFQQRLSLRPKSIRTQVLRAGLAGLALSLFTLSYKWLTASSIAVLSNIDVPLLMVLGPLVGIRCSLKTKVLSLIAMALLVFYVLSMDTQPKLYLGIGTLGVGCLLLCFGYYFIKRSMQEENEAVAILTPALAILFFGIVQHLYAGSSGPAWTWPMVCEAFLAGVGMFGAYYATMRLYALTDLAKAEFPTLISSLIMQPLEFIFLNTPMEAACLFSSAAFVWVIYQVLFSQNKSEAVAHG